MKVKILFFIIFLLCFFISSNRISKEAGKMPKTANTIPTTEVKEVKNSDHGDTNQILKTVDKIEQQYGKRIKKYARIHEVNPRVVKAIMIVESEGKQNAKSLKGAMGLMQLRAKTAEMLNVKNPYDPDENIFGGTKYLKILIERFGDDLNVVLVAYNVGPTKVEKRLQKGQNDFDNHTYVKKVKEVLNFI